MCVKRLLAVVMVLSAAGAAWAGPGRFDEESLRDMFQTMAARKLLADEPELMPFNIGVTVRDRVATLWGPVPSIEVAFRAELVLRSMFELTEVRNELFVSDLVQPTRKPLQIDNAPAPELIPPRLPVLPRNLFGAPGVLMGSDAKRPMSLPTGAAKPAPQPDSPRTTGGEGPGVRGALPRIDTPVPPLELAGDRKLESAVRDLLSDDARFRQLQFIVKDGRVYLRTLGSDTEALQEAARRISQFSGVAGVILVERP